MAESESSMNTKAAYIQSQYFTAACISRKSIVMDWIVPPNIHMLKPPMWLYLKIEPLER